VVRLRYYSGVTLFARHTNSPDFLATKKYFFAAFKVGCLDEPISRFERGFLLGGQQPLTQFAELVETRGTFSKKPLITITPCGR
jgi:hypothetical protein